MHYTLTPAPHPDSANRFNKAMQDVSDSEELLYLLTVALLRRLPGVTQRRLSYMNHVITMSITINMKKNYTTNIMHYS